MAEGSTSKRGATRSSCVVTRASGCTGAAAVVADAAALLNLRMLFLDGVDLAARR